MLPTESIANALIERYPPTTGEQVAMLLDRAYGIAGTVRRLSSEVDETFAVATAEGRRLVLKLASPAERPDLLAFQNGALRHLAEQAPNLPVPRLVAATSGEDCPLIALPDGTNRRVRVLSWLDGQQMAGTPRSREQLFAFGTVLAELDTALADYRPANVPEIELIWDLSRPDRVRPLLRHVADPRKYRLAAAAFDDLATVVGPVAAELPRQIIHNDANPFNVLVAAEGGGRITGIIDFGDMVAAPRVNDIAIALSYHVGGADGRGLVRAGLRGAASRLRLTEPEQQVLGALVRGRLAMTVAITEWRAVLRPDHAAYITRNQPAALAGLERLAPLSADGLRTFFFGNDA